MQIVGPTLETPRLVLRLPRAEDFEPFAAFMADPTTATYVGGPIPYNTAWRAWSTIAGAWALYGFSMFSIVEKATGQWVGRAGPWMPVNWPGSEVGWGIVASAQRKGYATEAATAAIDWAFDTLGWSEVIHCINPENLASIGVAQKLGSAVVKSGVPSGPPFHETWDLYGQTREAWRARRRG